MYTVGLLFVLSVYGGLTFITVLSLVAVDAIFSFDNRQVLTFDDFGLKVHVSAFMEVLRYRWQRPALDKTHDDDDDNGPKQSHREASPYVET